MKLNKKIMTAVLAGMMTVSAFASVLGAGLGTVDMRALMQQHRDFAKAADVWQKDVKQAQTDLESKAKTVKDEKAKQELAKVATADLNKKYTDVFGPIEKDILAQIKTVKDQKGLDYVVLKGAVVEGQSTDITQDVADKIK